MVGSEVDVVVKASNDWGVVDYDFQDYFVELNGQPAELPPTFGEVESKEYNIYYTDDYSKTTTITIPAGVGYYAPKGDSIELKLVMENAKVAEGANAIVTFNTLYQIDPESYKTIGTPAGDAKAPVVTVNLTSTRTLAAGANEIPVTITYTGSTGNVVEEKSSVTITTTPFVTEMSDEPVLLYNGQPITTIEVGKTYDANLFTVSTESYKTSGGDVVISKPDVVTEAPGFYNPETGVITGAVNTNYTLTFTYDLGVSYTATEVTFSFVQNVLQTN